MGSFLNSPFWKACVTHRQLLAFLLITGLAIVATITYTTRKNNDLRDRVNAEVSILTRSLSTAVPGSNVHVKVTRHADGGATITQTIVRTINVPTPIK